MKLNGNLVLNTDGSGELQNVFIERLASNPVGTPAGEKGRIIFNTTTSLYYYFDGAAWTAFATGGNATALQTEVDNIETTIGAIVNGNGTFNSVALSGVPVISGATSITNALSLLAAEAAGTDSLAELDDVTLGILASGDYLKYDGSKWVNDSLSLADVTDVTATAAEVNILDGATLSTTELNYVDGVTSPIQTQLDGKQASDAGLAALAAFNTNGIIVQTADNVYAGRTLQAPAEGVTITNANGVAGNPTIVLANDLGAVEALSGTGYAVRTGADTWTTREITGQAGRIAITNGAGVGSNTDVDLATVANSGSGTFQKLSTDVYGRVTGTQAVVASDITSLVDSAYVNVGGDTMSGSLTFSSGTVTGLPAPSGDTDAANKAYVDAFATGLSWKQAVRAATTLKLTGFQGTDMGGSPLEIDGIQLAVGDRILVKNQTNNFENGIWIVQAGDWTRALDMNMPNEFDGSAVFVREGAVNADTGWVQTAPVTVVGSPEFGDIQAGGTAAVPGSAVVFSQFSGAALYTWGVGLSSVGNTVSINLGSGIFEQGVDAVGIELHDSDAGAIILTTDGTARSTSDESKLHLLLNAAGGLAQDANGLKINSAAVSNAMLVNSSVGLNADGGTGSLALGQTLLVAGSSAQGINTSVTGQTITITAANATTASKGVASFSSGDFDVAAGVVTIKAGGVDNAQLANSTVILTGTTGNDSFALGESVAIVGGASGEVSTAVTNNQVAISVRDATSSLKGVASFHAADFTVTNGEVEAVAKDLDSLTDVEIVNPAVGETLVYNDVSGKFVNSPTYFLYQSAAPATTHTVSHNLGQLYCNVTVVDSTDEVVIPQSIKFLSTGHLVVTFTSAINCKVVVMGVTLGVLA